ncbi:MAG: CocE/NonD family hydrolase [Terriglobales bacterium]|jgi:dienelactone hydrolase/predicted negative regulator of RcsB-dependent stress response
MRSQVLAATLLIVCVAAAFVAAASAQSAPVVAAGDQRFHFTEKPGPDAVGLRVVEQYDFSRAYRPVTDALGQPYQGERARPLQTLIWYPAQKSSGKPMTVGDYTDLLAMETSYGKPELWSDWKSWIEGMKPTLKDSMWAVRDAPLLSGRFPVVIYAPSLSSMSWENADICEYLASHGYVVVASPSTGATSRDMTVDLGGINVQAQDISFLIGYAQTLPDTDMSEIAAAGFSWGGISNLFAAARDNRIDALVALEGSMRYFPGLVKAATDVHPEQMTIPMLFFTQGPTSLEKLARRTPSKDTEGPNVLNAWTHGDLITVEDIALVHTEHGSMFQRNEDIWKSYPRSHKADYTRADGIVGYAWVARYTLEFLDAYLKHDAQAMAFLKKTPADVGVPPHMMTADFRAGKAIPASLDAFRAELGRQGFDHAPAIYAAMLKDQPDFKLDEDAVIGWAHDLMEKNHLPEATDLLKLDVQVFPSSWNAYDSLGEAYTKAGQKQLAIDSYKKSLELNPANDDAKEKLKMLETAPPAK